MTSKKTAAQKRTKAPRNSDGTKQFDKDWERLSASGRYDMHRLKEAMLLLIANDGPLPAEYRDHELTGGMGRFPRMPHRRRFFVDLPTSGQRRCFHQGRHSRGIVPLIF